MKQPISSNFFMLKVLVAVMIVVAIVGLFLLPHRLTLNVSDGMRSSDQRRDQVYRELVSERTRDELSEHRWAYEYEERSSEYYKKKAREEIARERGEKIVSEREARGLNPDGTGVDQGAPNKTRERASAISKWIKTHAVRQE